VAPDELAELYGKFKSAILNLADDIEVAPRSFIWPLRSSKPTSLVLSHKKRMKIWIGAKAGALNDPKSIAADMSQIGHHGTGDYEVHVQTDNDLEYIMSLIKQTLK
jgi:predicted transport protein